MSEVWEGCPKLGHATLYCLILCPDPAKMVRNEAKMVWNESPKSEETFKLLETASKADGKVCYERKLKKLNTL